MRPQWLIPLAIIAPLASAYGLKSVTGDMMSAVFLALTLIVTAIALLAGPTRHARPSRRS